MVACFLGGVGFGLVFVIFVLALARFTGLFDFDRLFSDSDSEPSDAFVGVKIAEIRSHTL